VKKEIKNLILGKLKYRNSHLFPELFIRHTNSIGTCLAGSVHVLDCIKAVKMHVRTQSDN